MSVLSGSILPRRTTIALAMVVIGLATLGGVALAQGGGGDTFYACADSRNNRVTRIRVSESPTCRGVWDLVSWNSEGPAGVQGPIGPQGPQGPAGAASYVVTERYRAPEPPDQPTGHNPSESILRADDVLDNSSSSLAAGWVVLACDAGDMLASGVRRVNYRYEIHSNGTVVSDGKTPEPYFYGGPQLRQNDLDSGFDKARLQGNVEIAIWQKYTDGREVNIETEWSATCLDVTP